MISNTSKGHDQQCKKLMFIYLFSIKFYNNKEGIRNALAKEAKEEKKEKLNYNSQIDMAKIQLPQIFWLVSTFVSKLTEV